MGVDRRNDADTARALWIVGLGRGELRSETLPPVTGNRALVRARASAISRGTEALVIAGRVPESERARMRCPFQAGEFPWPVKYGYASVGVVEAGPSELRGRRVFCLHPHQDRYVVPADAVVALPDAVADERATFAANMETALNGVWDAPPVRRGMRVAVIGAGLVGLFVAWLVARAADARLEVVERDPARADLARTFGLETRAPEMATRGVDLVFHASGHPDGLVLALELSAFEATIIELSWYGDRPVSLPLGGAFHSQRLTLKSSQVGAVAPAMREKRTRAERLAEALALLAEPRFDGLVGERIGFDDLPAAIGRISDAPVTPPGMIVTYRE
ncbi:MAG TPA: zinc-binding alcohol dehydrogenase [Alphaproteobacteria bacterium]|nr:zinc-binding alcohol dehydrogenase [Alphaproteobacteria bacterium]